MNTSTETPSQAHEMKATGLMEFGGKTQLVYTLGDTQFISLRPIVDQIGIDWRTQKKAMLDDDNVLFYGTLLLEDGKILQAPCKYDLKNAFFPSYNSEDKQKTAVFFHRRCAKRHPVYPFAASGNVYCPHQHRTC